MTNITEIRKLTLVIHRPSLFHRGQWTVIFPDSKSHTFPDNPIPPTRLTNLEMGNRGRDNTEEPGEPGGMTFAVLQHPRYQPSSLALDYSGSA